MKQPAKQVEQEVPLILEGLMRSRPASVSQHGLDAGDLSIKVGGLTFLVECRGTGTAAPVALAVEHLRSARKRVSSRVVTVVAVPFMGAVGKRLCEDAEVSWIDLSGNAHVEAPGLRIRIEGQPNRFKKRGRPENVFASKSSRITRLLLLHPKRSWLQHEIAEASKLTQGYTSRVVHRLEEKGLLIRDDQGGVQPKDPDLLLDAWTERYDFGKHEILKGHVLSRSSEELLRQLVDAFDSRQIKYAATALPPTFRMSREGDFSNFRPSDLSGNSSFLRPVT